MLQISQVKAFCKAKGVKSILQTAKQEIHGVNPTLTYERSGMSFDLPRFCSPEMKQARTMNKIAVSQAKRPVASSFSKASAEDLQRLTSNTVEDSFKRVQWTNPKDGQVYNLLDNGRTEDGKAIVRILDAEGAFVKEAALKPKSIVIADMFEINNPAIPHGLLVETFARRNNPFATYYKFNIPGNGHSFNLDDAAKVLKEASSTINSDYLSLSLSNTVKFGNKRVVPYKDSLDAVSNVEIDKAMEFKNAVNEFVNRETRVLIGAGNSGEMGVNSYIAKIKNTEGVGSIEPVVRKNGKVYVSDFSSSRNSGFTQHYEVGDFKTKPVFKDGNIIGYNFTGKSGCDISVSEISRIANDYNSNLAAKSQKISVKKERISNEMEKLEVEYQKLQDKISDEKSKIPFENYFDACAEIESKYNEQSSKLWNEISSLHFEKFDCENELERLAQNLVQKNGIVSESYWGTSLSTPTRTAKLALNDMMEGVL